MAEVTVQPTTVALHGIMLELNTPEALMQACHRAREAGYLRYEAYSPFPVHGLDEVMPYRPTRLPRLVLFFAAVGGVGAYLMQWFAMAVHYPLNIGGRPLNSWPYYMPITFELAILLAAFAAVFGMILRNGLPLPYHPVFNVERFRRASQDRFFLCIHQDDPKFDPHDTRAFLTQMARKSEEVYDVVA